jgi:hypothetical protein
VILLKLQVGTAAEVASPQSQMGRLIPLGRSISRQSPKSASGGAHIRGRRLTALPSAEGLVPSSCICFQRGSTNATRQSWLVRSSVDCGSSAAGHVNNGDRRATDPAHRCPWGAWRSNNAGGRPVSQTIIFFRSFSPNRARPCAGRFCVRMSCTAGRCSHGAVP